MVVVDVNTKLSGSLPIVYMAESQTPCTYGRERVTGVS